MKNLAKDPNAIRLLLNQTLIARSVKLVMREMYEANAVIILSLS